MASNIIDIPINVNMTITRETADICLSLINLYLENNPGTFVDVDRDGSTDQIRIAHGFVPFGKDGDADE